MLYIFIYICIFGNFHRIFLLSTCCGCVMFSLCSCKKCNLNSLFLKCIHFLYLITYSQTGLVLWSNQIQFSGVSSFNINALSFYPETSNISDKNGLSSTPQVWPDFPPTDINYPIILLVIKLYSHGYWLGRL